MLWEQLSTFAKQRALNEIRDHKGDKIGKQAERIYSKRFRRALQQISKSGKTKVTIKGGYLCSELGLHLSQPELICILQQLKREKRLDTFGSLLSKRIIGKLIQGISFYQARIDGSIQVQIFPQRTENNNDEILKILLDDRKATEAEYTQRWAEENGWKEIKKIPCPNESSISLLQSISYGYNSLGEIQLLPTSLLLIDANRLLTYVIEEILHEVIEPVFLLCNRWGKQWNKIYFEEEVLWLSQIKKNNYTFNVEGKIKTINGEELCHIPLIPELKELVAKNKVETDLSSILFLDPIVNAHSR